MTWILLLLGLVAGLQIEDKAHKICKVYGYNVVKAKFGREEYLLCLRLQSIASSLLTSDQSALLLDPEVYQERTESGYYPLDDVMLAYGFPVENPALGSAEGYIGEDHQFYGVLHLGNRTLHADPYGRDDPTKKFGLFENDHVAAPRTTRSDHSQIEAGFAQLPYFPYQYEMREHKPGIARSRVCELLLLADKEFFDKDANSSLKHVLSRMLHAVAQADIIFRNADFDEDGIPDNIGFSVKYILVLTSHETNTRVFGDLLKERSVDGRTYLMRFARLRRLSEVCLGVAFSGHAFNNRTLGLSFTSLGGGMGGAAGGMCDRRAFGRSFNTLALAHATADGMRVPERIAALTLAHEMGHSFGAHHDDNFPNPECRGYLMGSQSSTSETGHNYEFSLCSKRLIAATLGSMSYCMAVVDRPYCGNGIVEEGEACDCALPSLCNSRDPCCTPRAGGALAFEDGALHKEGCSVAPTATCHPSQGLCCNANCHFANLTLSGIDCTWQDMACTCVNINECRCGLGGRCLSDRSCHAAECAALGLRECNCPETGTGGILRELKMCGVCCQLHDGNTTKCVGAEFAAKRSMSAHSLPNDWPDPEYKGPNVTLRLCNTITCTYRTIRAWPAGDVCVMNNAVGMCSPRGVCKSVKMLPASNIYPDVVSVTLMRRTRSASKTLKSGITKFITVLLVI